MKIYDCCLFYDEKMLLNLRMNILNKEVHKFVIVESNFTHSGKFKKFNFNINDYPKFKNKITYIQVKNKPKNLHKITKNLDKEKVNDLKILNALILENYQRDKILEGLKYANKNDLVIVSDVDEIPNLKKLKDTHLKKSIILFKQDIFYYKFNLKHPTFEWFGSKAIRKNKLTTPQKLRNIKNKIYPLWRIDIMFSQNKRNDISIVKNGGWHFTNIKAPKNIFKKFKNFLHHVDFEESKLKKQDIEKYVKNHIVPYGHTIDKRKDRWSEKIFLKKVSLKTLPSYLFKNIKKYKKWIAT